MAHIHVQQLQITEVNEYVLVAEKEARLSPVKNVDQGVDSVHYANRIGDVWWDPAAFSAVFL